MQRSRTFVVRCRRATPKDAEAVAALHADSWRRNYRGAYSDEFLDLHVVGDRRRVWNERLTTPGHNDRTLLADVGGDIVGFSHVILHEDETWGALLDNLHVRHDSQRRGLGRRLLAETAALVTEEAPQSPLYLWVLETNARARDFYEALGGRCVERQASEPAGGGTIIGLRYVWEDLGRLIGR